MAVKQYNNYFLQLLFTLRLKCYTYIDTYIVLIPGAKRPKIRCRLACRRIFELGTRRKHEKTARLGRILNVFEDCGSTKCGSIWYQRGKRPFCPNIIVFKMVMAYFASLNCRSGSSLPEKYNIRR